MRGERQSSPGQNIGNQSRHEGNQQDVAQDKSGLMHKVCGGHFPQGAEDPNSILRKSPGKKAQTSQHHRRRVYQPPADAPLNQVQKGKHLTAIHVRILQNFPLQTGLFMARQHGHHLNTVADMYLR